MDKPKTIISIAVALLVAMPTGARTEEIVVTAQKREQFAREVGLTMSILDRDAYRELTRGTLEGLAGQVVNVHGYGTNSYLQSFHMRGIGLNEFQGQYDSPVAQHIDDVYISKPWMAARRHYDIERVEVLHGPQGTLFGRNTTGGSVNYYTRPPSDAFAASLQLDVDEHERYAVQGMINGALSSRLNGRLSLLAESGSGGPQLNILTGSEHGRPKVYDVRGQLLWQGEQLTMRGLVHGGRDRSEKIAWKGPGIFNLGSDGFCPELLAGDVSRKPASCSKFAGFAALAGFPEGEVEPPDEFTINQNTPPSVNDSYHGGYLRFDHDNRRSTLTSITAYEYYERIHIEDSQSDIFDATSTHYYNEIDQLTQELRLTGQPVNRWRYILGLFYERDDLVQVDGSDLSEQPLPGITPVFADQFFAQFGLTVESTALFGYQELDLNDRLILSAGVRYTVDITELRDAILGVGNLPQVGEERFVTPCVITTYPNGPIGSPACPFLGPEALPFADRRKDRDLSWRTGAQWIPNDNVMLYANLTTGYRSGGYSLPLAGPVTEFEPENLFAQEIGFKAQLKESAVSLNAAVFRYSYDDVQVNVDDPVSPLVPTTRNVGVQRSIGSEIALDWTPNERWLLKQGLGWLDAKYEDTDRVISTYSGVVPLEGKRPINTPEWTYAGLVRYQRPIARRLNMSVSLDYNWSDERFLEVTNQPFDLAEAYTVANLRLAVASDDERWETALYVTNLLDERYLTYINNFSFFKLDIFGAPRTVGATVRFRVE